MKKKLEVKKIVVVILILIIVAFLILIGLKLLEKNKEKHSLKVDLVNDLSVEINEKAKISDFISSIKNGTLITEDKEIDTSKLGSQKINLKIDSNKKTYDYDFSIRVVDTTAPVITSKETFSTLVGHSIDLLKDVQATDNSKEEIKVTIEGKYDFDSEGVYKLNYVAIDSSKNKAKKEVTLKVDSDPNNRVIKTSKGYTLKIVNGVASIDGIIIANKTYGLPSDYGNGLTSETLNALSAMQSDASVVGLNLYNSSGFRSYYDQKYIYDNYVLRDGQSEADRYSARAGHSEHQTGLAFDLNTIDWSFADTKEGIWVNDNCYKYGFILRYPKEKESITGYMYEPWHLRYVGTTLASKLYNGGNWITLEEYFGIDSKY